MGRVRTSWRSFPALNRLERCWFIFARGATPVTGVYSIQAILSGTVLGTMNTAVGKEWRTINGHVQELLGLCYADQAFNIHEYAMHHLLLRYCSLSCIIRMCAVVNDAVHVQVQVVDFNRFIRNLLKHQWVPLREPSKELGNSCTEANVADGHSLY
jgi:hypothetical protein